MALLRALSGTGAGLDVIISDHGKKLLAYEEDLGPSDVNRYATNVYSNDDLFSPPASGSARYDAMVIVPCTVSTAGKIRNTIGDNLITRAAQVALKENRKLVIVPRETPLSTGQLEVLYSLSGQGVAIVPASPAFYHRPEDFGGLDDYICQKILSLLDIDIELIEPFDGE